MKLVLWNIRSIRSNRDYLASLLSSRSPDVIVLNETWLKKDQSVNFKNYVSVRQDRNDGKGGIAFLIKKIIPFRVIE